MSNTYTVEIVCDNCDFVGEKTLPKGTAASHSMECPYCGCKTAHKQTNKTVAPTYPRFPKPPKPLPWVDDDWTRPSPPIEKMPYVSTKPAPRQILDISSALHNDISCTLGKLAD